MLNYTTLYYTILYHTSIHYTKLHLTLTTLHSTAFYYPISGDPQQRFVILGFGNDTRVMMRDFRVDEPEIEEFIEHWRRLIASTY